jgi:hypothetical protein
MKYHMFPIDMGNYDIVLGVVTGYIGKCRHKLISLDPPWMILGAKFRSWDNFPWFFQKKDSLF